MPEPTAPHDPTPPDRVIDRLLAEYGSSHRDAVNKRIHWICVPAIVWTVLALLWCIPVPEGLTGVPMLNWASAGLALACAYYVYLSPRLAVGLLALGAACLGSLAAYEALVPVPLWATATLVFVVAWVFQFIGHKIEGERPSFLEDVQFLLIGPAWLLHFVYRRVGLSY